MILDYAPDIGYQDETLMEIRYVANVVQLNIPVGGYEHSSKGL